MNILEFLQDQLLYLDGGMGTLLQSKGLQPGELPERWNLTHPAIITDIHRAYFDAGSHVVNANTFGANGLKFSDAELEEIIRAALENARAAAAQSTGTQPKWVALDMGPTGKMLKPYGDLNFEDAVSVFAQVVRLGVKYGADLIFIETMGDSYETKAALLAAKENSCLPVFVSNAYGADGKLLTGASPAAMVALLEGMGADAIGVNCSLGPKALAPVVEEYLQYASVPVLLKPNAGLPVVTDGETGYDITAEEFAREVAVLITGGVRIAGGCCGTTPAYIAALTDAAKNISPVPVTAKNHALISSFTHAVCIGQTPLLVGERINPTGKKLFREALCRGDMDYILREGISQEEAGVHILDVNVGLPEIDEKTMLREAVCQLQAVINLPLQIDTSDPSAMEAALRCYNGKALLNSVSGKQETMDAIFPLMKKYGGVAVALTLDENGIPETAAGRIAVARKILAEAEKQGISRKNLIFDPLALTISADPTAAEQTLQAVKAIRQELDCPTILGISNISFGLPRREILNSAFFTLALQQGLSAAILNPHSPEMMGAYRAYLALAGKDPNCAGFIAHAARNPRQEPLPSALPDNLQQAIVRGLKDRASAITGRLLQEREPMDIIHGEILPALNAVGVDFENKTLFLPQLLMSAEAAKAAFGQIQAHMPGGRTADKCAFVLATVKGDIHDIGKNIVRLLLENYGFAVTDLGRDVAPETIAEAVVSLHAPLAGLSALMTTTVPAMAETIRLLRQKAPWCKVVVGGAVLNPQYADAIGADRYARDAMETVRYAEEIFNTL